MIPKPFSPVKVEKGPLAPAGLLHSTAPSKSGFQGMGQNDPMLIGVLAVAPVALPVVIPAPVEMRVTKSSPFRFSSSTRLVDPGNLAASRALKAMLARSAGLNLTPQGKGNRVVFRMKSDTGRLRPDWYWLTVTPAQILVEYSSEAGAFYAVQTLRQLLPDAIESPKAVKGVGWTVPAVVIADGPRFSWRGMMLDESRHFFGTEFVKRQLDRMALLKQNVFHWHLTDDGGWRIAIKKYPNLTKMGAWRMDTGEVWPGGRWNYANIQFVGEAHPKKYGGFYTQAQIKEIVKYAADRYITVVPEIEMPGHGLAAMVSYPELMCDNVPKADKPGKSVSNVFCAGNDGVLRFLEDVLDEVLALFPSKFVHVGADEVLKDYWHNCPQCQKRMTDNGLKDEHELQSWFIRHFDAHLAKKRRRLVGWDEILEGGLAPGATVMSWRGISGGIAAAKAGRNVVMSPTSHCYFDYSYQAISTEHAYSYEPVPAELTPEEGAKVLGGQYNVWTEFIADTRRCEVMQYPRALAMAEVLWTPAENKDVTDFRVRANRFYSRLDALKVAYALPAPEVPFTSVFFKDSVAVRPLEEDVPFTLRFTMDGSKPTAKSPECKGDVSVDRACTLSFAYVSPSGVVGDVSRIDCRPMSTTRPEGLASGLKVSRYLLEGTPSKMPDFAKLTPQDTAVSTEVGSEARPRAEKFGVVWEGWLDVPTTGTTTFWLTSDDGSRLWIEDALVVDNDGPHGAVEKGGAALLPAGTYRVRIEWFDQGGGNSLKFEMAAPGGDRGPAPPKLLWHKPS